MSNIIASVRTGDCDHRQELTEAELANISGGKSSTAHAGKATFSPLLITKHYDKASPVLL